MSSLKNLMIVAVLAAVGYGVYTSLSRNTDSNQSANSSQGWPAVPKGELPGAKPLGTPLTGTIPQGKPSSYPPLTPPSSVGMGGSTAPPFTPGPAAVAPGGTPGVSPGVVPYPSSSRSSSPDSPNHNSSLGIAVPRPAKALAIKR